MTKDAYREYLKRMKDMFEIKNELVFRVFHMGYVIAFSIGRKDETRDVMVEKYKISLRLMKLAHEFEPDNPHILMQLVWQYEFMHAEPEEMLKVIAHTLKKYAESKVTQEYTYRDYEVDLLLYAKQEYLKKFDKTSIEIECHFIGEEADRWYE